MVFKRLRDVNLQYNIKKCKFYITKVMYLNLIISCDGIKIDPKKVAIIVNQESPINI